VGRHVKMASFRGKPTEDGIEWLKDYKHYCACHSADSSFQLANIKYFLKDEASVWWRNQEDAVKSFEEFCDLFLKVYGNLNKTRNSALKLLSNRPQRAGESCFAYVQAILRLC